MNKRTAYNIRSKRTCIWLFLGIIGLLNVNANEVIDKSSLCCIYKHFIQTANSNDNAAIDSTVTILEIGENLAKYGDYSAYTGKVPENFHSGYKTDDPHANDYFTVYQNYPQTKETLVREALLPSFYIYTEKIDLPWELLDSKEETILGYKCQKAKTSYAGRTWIAYYASEIPLSNGPWKLIGLPGLVLKAESEDGIHSFIAQRLFSIDMQPIHYEKNAKDIKAKRNNFISLRNRLKTDKRWIKNPGYYITAANCKSIVIVKEENKYNLTPRLEINKISLPLNGWEHKFKPLELK